MDDCPDPRQGLAGAGLCATCDHARVVDNDRGSMFVQCGLAATDGRFRKYPTVPVVRCPGHRPTTRGAD